MGRRSPWPEESSCESIRSKARCAAIARRARPRSVGLTRWGGGPRVRTSASCVTLSRHHAWRAYATASFQACGERNIAQSRRFTHSEGDVRSWSLFDSFLRRV